MVWPAKAIEFMITDAMLEADPYLHISDAITDPREYVNLTDAVLHDIAKSKEPVRSNGAGARPPWSAVSDQRLFAGPGRGRSRPEVPSPGHGTRTPDHTRHAPA